MKSYRISGLPAASFAHLYGLNDAELAVQGAMRYSVDAKPGFPDRIELRDLEVGERALLLNYVHQDAATPYRASHAIFVREGATQAYDRVGEIPTVLRRRPISLRAFNSGGFMVDADLVNGSDLEPAIERLFNDLNAEYIQAHYAKPGCYAARITRVTAVC